MSYTLKIHKDRQVFYFEGENLSFENFNDAIDSIIHPIEKSDIEITSWTIAYTFKKSDIEIYFEHFYDPDCYYSFELYPVGKDHSAKDQSKLKSILDQLDDYFTNKQ